MASMGFFTKPLKLARSTEQGLHAGVVFTIVHWNLLVNQMDEWNIVKWTLSCAGGQGAERHCMRSHWSRTSCFVIINIVHCCLLNPSCESNGWMKHCQVQEGQAHGKGAWYDVWWKKGVVPNLCSRVHIAACVFCLFTAFLWFLWFLFCLGSCGHSFLCSGLSEACRDALYSAMLVIKNHATEGCWWSKVCIPACVLKLFFHTVTGKACLTLHYCLRSVVIHSSSDCASASGLIVTFM